MMDMRISRGNLVKSGLAAAALLAGGIMLRVLTHISLSRLQEHTDNPARTYEEAVERLVQIQAREEANPAINPICRTALLTHGRKMDRAVVLMHGMTNCPRQYAELAPLLYERGYNVLIPLMPHSGLADRNTDDLKHLRAEELRDCCNTMVDIVRGLGTHVSYAGLSVGGSMAAWVAQNRADVDRVVIIAPSFTLSRKMSISLSRLAMHLLSWLPNLMTQRFLPMKEIPFYNYWGFATRGLGQMMRLGFSVFDAAKNRAPAAPSIVLVTNTADPAVNNKIARELAERWRDYGAARVETYEFDAKYKLIHDIIDPLQKEQQTQLVYPILLQLISTRERVTLQPS